MKRFTVVINKRAAREIDDAACWWAERGSPTRIDDAIGVLLDRLQRFPYSAPRVQIGGEWSEMRRAAVDPVRYHLYYRVDPKAKRILVERFWHQQRPGPDDL